MRLLPTIKVSARCRHMLGGVLCKELFVLTFSKLPNFFLYFQFCAFWFLCFCFKHALCFVGDRAHDLSSGSSAQQPVNIQNVSFVTFSIAFLAAFVISMARFVHFGSVVFALWISFFFMPFQRSCVSSFPAFFFSPFT